MDMEGLRTFLVLANTKNYTRAAGQLFVAQSTVTNRIAELERELGVNLFARTNRKVELTREGERFRIYADNVIALTESSLAEITAAKRFDNYLRIGSADSIYEGHLAPRILQYRKENPRPMTFQAIREWEKMRLLTIEHQVMLEVVFQLRM